MTGAAAWDALLQACVAVFTRPSFLLFWTLVSAWVLCPGRRTVTRMIRVADPEGTHAHDAYHRFLRAGTWSLTALWCVFRRKSSTRSNSNRPLIPGQIVH